LERAGDLDDLGACGSSHFAISAAWREITKSRRVRYRFTALTASG
jgi:hypothetical protein